MRLLGLMGRRRLKEGEGLLLSPCSSVQTLFMRFPIDVIFVDREAEVVKVAPAVAPFRLAFGGRGARDALEVAAGTVIQPPQRRHSSDRMSNGVEIFLLYPRP